MDAVHELTLNGGGLQEVHARLECHLLQRRRIRLDPDPVERPIEAFKRHVVGDQWEVSVVNADAVSGEHVTDFLSIIAAHQPD